MKVKFLILTAIFCLAAFLDASAQEKTLSGDLTLLGQVRDLTGEKAKFNEYRDIRTGVTGSFDVQYERGNYYLDFYGNEVARRDQKYDLSGGKWGNFKYDLWYDQIPHNFTTNAKTFYTGRGGTNLTYTPQPPSTFLPNTNISTWDTFDYSVDRKNYGAGFKLDMLKPFFLNLSFNREERNGVYPLGAAGTSPGGISIELPTPIKYTNDIFKVEAGYIKNPLSLIFGYTYGQFENDHGNLNFRNPATANTAATTDTFTLPSDSDYYQLNFKGAVKLPWRSKFNADIAYSRNESSKNLLNSYVSDTTAAASNIGIRGRTGILLNDYVFNGKLDIQNYAFSLTTNPIYFLDAKVFYKYYETRNKSDQITTTDTTVAAPPAGVGPTFSNEDRLFDYLTYRGGGQLGFKLPLSFYLLGEYTRVHTSRKREDVPTNDDDIYNVELRWSGVDFLAARVGYEKLHRHADFHAPEVLGPTDINNIEPFIRRYDVAAKEQDTVKASVDLFPFEDLNISLGYRWRQIRYKDTILGLRNWRGNEYHADVDYLVMKRVKLFAFFDYEYAKLDQFQRTLPSGTAGVFNPNNPPTATAFNWTVTETDYNWGYGVGSDIYAIPKKLTFRLQYSYIKSRGFADYTYLLPANLLAQQAPANTRTQDNIDIGNLDNYSLTYYLAKVTYNPIKSLALSLGWAYEKYNYDDAQLNGYQYVARSSTGAILSFLTGAYANQNYRANVWFLSGSYLF